MKHRLELRERLDRCVRTGPLIFLENRLARAFGRCSLDFERHNLFVELPRRLRLERVLVAAIRELILFLA